MPFSRQMDKIMRAQKNMSGEFKNCWNFETLPMSDINVQRSNSLKRIETLTNSSSLIDVTSVCYWLSTYFMKTWSDLFSLRIWPTYISECRKR